MKAYADHTFEVEANKANTDVGSEVKNMELCFIFCNGSKRSEGFAKRSGREILRMINFPDRISLASKDGSPEGERKNSFAGLTKPEVREGKVPLPEQQWNFHGREIP
ncbi:hypothetical protein [Limisalsivibrio acetivorans]|uniref:hypothetical protein n=1 Tax=Limisalsivibrio acetivorans TaxID=1304888 RepID=UPI0003B6F825|nr:hypothetical protein [Limisalsivibrio acetivorans]